MKTKKKCENASDGSSRENVNALELGELIDDFCFDYAAEECFSSDNAIDSYMFFNNQMFMDNDGNQDHSKSFSEDFHIGEEVSVATNNPRQELLYSMNNLYDKFGNDSQQETEIVPKQCQQNISTVNSFDTKVVQNICDSENIENIVPNFDCDFLPFCEVEPNDSDPQRVNRIINNKEHTMWPDLSQISDHNNYTMSANPKQIIDHNDQHIWADVSKIIDHNNYTMSANPKQIIDQNDQNTMLVNSKEIIDHNVQNIWADLSQIIDHNNYTMSANPKQIVDQNDQSTMLVNSKQIIDHHHQNIWADLSQIIDHSNYTMSANPKQVIDQNNQIMWADLSQIIDHNNYTMSADPKRVSDNYTRSADPSPIIDHNNYTISDDPSPIIDHNNYTMLADSSLIIDHNNYTVSANTSPIIDHNNYTLSANPSPIIDHSNYTMAADLSPIIDHKSYTVLDDPSPIINHNSFTVSVDPQRTIDHNDYTVSTDPQRIIERNNYFTSADPQRIIDHNYHTMSADLTVNQNNILPSNNIIKDCFCDHSTDNTSLSIQNSNSSSKLGSKAIGHSPSTVQSPKDVSKSSNKSSTLKTQCQPKEITSLFPRVLKTEKGYLKFRVVSPEELKKLRIIQKPDKIGKLMMQFVNKPPTRVKVKVERVQNSAKKLKLDNVGNVQKFDCCSL